VLEPLLRCVETPIFAGDLLHGDDTNVPVLSKCKTHTGSFWVNVRGDRPVRS
jgi:transposase